MSLDKEHFTVTFYNLENLFDTQNDKKTLDEDFTPDGFKKWDERKFSIKVEKMAKAIARIGLEDTDRSPVLIGVAEVELSLIHI